MYIENNQVYCLCASLVIIFRSLWLNSNISLRTSLSLDQSSFSVLTPEIKTIQSPTPSFILFLVMADDISAFPVPLITFLILKEQSFWTCICLYCFIFICHLFKNLKLSSVCLIAIYPVYVILYIIKINQFLLWILTLLYSYASSFFLLQMKLRH